MVKTIKVKFDISECDLTVSDVEGLWCSFDEKSKKISLDNIPVYKHWISYRDEISVKLLWDEIWFDKLIRKNWNKTIRLYFKENSTIEWRENLLSALKELGLTYEWYNWFLFWINIPKEVATENVFQLFNTYSWKISYEISDK